MLIESDRYVSNVSAFLGSIPISGFPPNPSFLGAGELPFPCFPWFSSNHRQLLWFLVDPPRGRMGRKSSPMRSVVSGVWGAGFKTTWCFHQVQAQIKAMTAMTAMGAWMVNLVNFVTQVSANVEWTHWTMKHMGNSPWKRRGIDSELGWEVVVYQHSEMGFAKTNLGSTPADDAAFGSQYYRGLTTQNGDI